MEVEGPIILGKVDIDINFGRPIPVKNYISSKWKLKRMMTDNNVYLNTEDFKKISAFKKICINLMHDYMNAIYSHDKSQS